MGIPKWLVDSANDKTYYDKLPEEVLLYLPEELPPELVPIELHEDKP